MTQTEKPDQSAELKAAVAKAIQDEFAVTSWQKKGRLRFIVQCPTGQKCLVQHLTTMDLLEADLIEEIDFFTKQLFAEQTPGEDEGVEESVWKLLRDIHKRVRFHQLLNKLMVVGVVKPRVIDDGVAIIKNREGKDIVKLGVKKVELQDGQVLASAIDFADRMAIFVELNKPLTEIKPFRPEQVASLAGMESVPQSEGKAK